MPVEVVELTMSHVGLGNLNEYALMVLFGNAHSHALVKDLQLTPDQIKNEAGSTLYPAYFMVHLTVPPSSLLSSYKLWDDVSIGVDVRRFGDTLLESRYAIGKGRRLPDDPMKWNVARFPMMEGNNLLVIDSEDDTNPKRKVSNPGPGLIADLPKLARAPKGIMLSKQARTSGFINIDFQGVPFEPSRPLYYDVIPGRDVATGHAMIFAKFVEIMDIAENRFFSEQFQPQLSCDVLNCLSILDREIFYFGNCYAGETLRINLRGSIEIPEDHGLQDESDYIPAAFLNIIFEIRQQRNNVLLVLAKARKVFAVPMRNQDLVSDISRIVAQTKREEIA